MKKAARSPSIGLNHPRAARRLLSGLLVLGPLLFGCQGHPGKEQLGRVVFALPEVPAAKVPYKLDQLDRTPPLDRPRAPNPKHTAAPR